MRSAKVAFLAAIAFAAEALGHGYVYRITADNTVYPGYDLYIDPYYSPKLPRIAYGVGSTGPIFDLTSPNIACNTPHSPIPSAIAEVRASSTVTFHWTRWLYSHKGPISAWMAPYDGTTNKVNVNQLKFFKIGEEAVDSKANIKPGNYVVRHEVTSNGTVTPASVTFPGGYKKDEPGFKYDIFNTTVPPLPYPFVGPAVYVPSSSFPPLTPKERVVVSPTGQGEAADKTYLDYQEKVLTAQSATTESFDAAGG
ncbi:glycosyl hydrolase family 61-domain-containing protein [Apodospora peruviana]|uniref:lytic cellulose monooxygenase (C4-dehydrogenating) n=1 Tax=Apodospora peruviana TaxID=516989 RepID=A0AAE0IKC6_9PEZI|nr:glycosyl hydrolase family 61-domain-containing protein [Apodospora peruviana]